MIKNNLHILIPLIGGLLIIVSIFMPWITFFGGLHTYSGISGLNGQILLAGGIVTLFLCKYLSSHPTQKAQVLVGIVGFLEVGLTSFLLLQAWQAVHPVSSNGVDSMMIEGMGPGLFVALGGALLVFSVLFLRLRQIAPQHDH